MIREYIDQRKRAFTEKSDINTLKRQKISVYDSETEYLEKGKYSIYQCLIAEAEVEGATYVLSMGEWKKISDSFLSEVVDYVAGIVVAETPYLESDVSIWEPPTEEGKDGKNKEGVYNQNAAEHCNDLALFDKAHIAIAGAKRYEVCDLLHKDKSLIHLKRYTSGAASISHLFSQGRFYGDAFVSEEQCRKGMREHVKNIHEGNAEKINNFLEIIPEKREDLTTNEFTVVFCVLHTKQGMGVAELPFMSKYELMHAHKHLQNIGYKCSIVFRKIVTGPTE